MGATVGDVVLAIEKLTAPQITRISNNDMIFTLLVKHILLQTIQTEVIMLQLNLMN